MPNEPSKQANGLAARAIATTSLNASPLRQIKNDIFRPQQLPIESKLQPVPELYRDMASNQFVDVSNFEGSNPKPDLKLFEYNQGFKGTEPLILFLSEFSSLYENQNKNEIGQALQLKNDAKVLNAKTALSILLQKKDFKDIAMEKMDELSAFVADQNKYLYEISNAIQDAIAVLDLSSFRFSFENFQPDEASFVYFLRRNGYVGPEKFSNTKIWQLFLAELKKTISVHSSGLLGIFPQKNDDSDPYALPEPQIGSKRIWLNPYVVLPPIKSFSTFLEDNKVTTQKLKIFSDLDSSQYYDLSSLNAELAVTNTSDPNNRNATQLSSGDLRELAKKVQSSQILKEYRNSGRDISIIANAIFKEILFSSALSDTSNRLTGRLNDEYGYAISSLGDNFQIWDHVIGRFTKNVIKFQPEQTGNGKSLVSLSQKIEGDYKVLPFERLGSVDKQLDVTPGSIYYIESSINTANINQIDFLRLDKLISSVNGTTQSAGASQTIDRIFSFLGYEKQGSGYERSKISSEFTLEGLVNRLTIVSKIYKTCLDVQLDVQPIQPVNGADKFAPSLTGTKLLLNATKLRGLSDSALNSVRLAATICKAAIEPQGLYSLVSQDLKSLLFMWVMNTIMSKVDSSPEAKLAVNILQQQINEKLCAVTSRFSSGTDGGSNPILEEDAIRIASNEMRLYPIDIGIDALVGTLGSQNIIQKFQLNSEEGLWKAIIDALTSVYTRYSLYVAGRDGNEHTKYSGISKSAYLYSYFDLILRIISCQTPENLLGVYQRSIEATASTDPNDPFKLNIKQLEIGFMLSQTSSQILEEYFDPTLLSNPASSFVFNNRLKNSISYLNEEENFKFSTLKFCKSYLASLNEGLIKFRRSVDRNLKGYINNVVDFFGQDSLLGLDELQRSALFNLSISRNQMMMNRYVMSEYYDRLKSSTDSETKLKKNPEFNSFSNGFSALLNFNDSEIISYDNLSPYFRSFEFQKVKSINKKIISVGIPPKLVNSLVDYNVSNENEKKRALSNIIRIRLFKVDRLRPTLVYKSQNYLFEVNRFPTRMISNWDLDALREDNTNILRIPTKLFDEKRNQFINCRNFSSAFPENLYGSVLRQEEKEKIYANHAKSFLAEEYLRWITDTKFDETRYYKYNNLNKELNTITGQYKVYLDYLRNKGYLIDPAQKQPAPKPGTTKATFVDPLSKETYVIPVDGISNPNSDGLLSVSPVSITSLVERPVKGFNINMDDTMISFFQNETILSESNSELKKKMVLPKKFDRVFNILFDPDDFELDAAYDERVLDSALNESPPLIQKVSSNLYKHRDTSSDDVTFDEYFVTIEPYNYVLPYA